MKGYEPEKFLCYSMCPQHNVKYHRTAISYVMRITIVTLIWIIFALIFRPPAFNFDIQIAGSVFRIISLILQLVILVYSFMTFYKYGKRENPDEAYVKTYAKVTIALLSLQFLILVVMFILFFLLLIKFIEEFDYGFDVVWLAVSRAVMLLCLFATAWEIYLLVMFLLEGETPRAVVPKKTKVVKSTPVYTNTTANNNIAYQDDGIEGAEDDFMAMNVQGGKYIGETSSQVSEPKGPEMKADRIEPVPAQGNEDDFFGPRMDQGDQYLDNSAGKKDNEAQFYQTDNPNQDLNKKGKDNDQPL